MAQHLGTVGPCLTGRFEALSQQSEPINQPIFGLLLTPLSVLWLFPPRESKQEGVKNKVGFIASERSSLSHLSILVRLFFT